MQRYRADYSETTPDGAVQWFAKWMGGPSLSKINNCRIAGHHKRLTAYITGEPDTWFSIPAATRIRGKHVRGYITIEDGEPEFRAMDSHKHLLEPSNGPN